MVMHFPNYRQTLEKKQQAIFEIIHEDIDTIGPFHKLTLY
jgi:hypothetical protein